MLQLCGPHVFLLDADGILLKFTCMVNFRYATIPCASSITFKESPIFMKVLLRRQSIFLRCMDRGPKSISIGGQYSIKKKTQELGGSFLCSNLAI